MGQAYRPRPDLFVMELNALVAVRETFAVMASKGASGYKFPHDLRADVKTSKPDFWPSASAEEKKFNIGKNKLDQWGTFYHETGHIIAYYAYNPPHWPKTAYPGWHHRTDSHSDQGFAITEGWAEAVEIIVSQVTGKDMTISFPSNSFRGAGGIRPKREDEWQYKGETTGSDSSGELVEGSIANCITGHNGVYFKLMMEALMATSPDRYWDLFQGFIANAVAGQQQTNVTAQAATTEGVATLYSLDTASTGKATEEIPEEK